MKNYEIINCVNDRIIIKLPEGTTKEQKEKYISAWEISLIKPETFLQHKLQYIHRRDEWKWSEKRTEKLTEIDNLVHDGKSILALVPDMFSGHADYVRINGNKGVTSGSVWAVTQKSGSYLAELCSHNRFDYLVIDDGMDQIAILPITSAEGKTWMED